MKKPYEKPAVVTTPGLLCPKCLEVMPWDPETSSPPDLCETCFETAKRGNNEVVS